MAGETINKDTSVQAQAQAQVGDGPVRRPGLPQRSDTVRSQYVEMLLGQDEIPKYHTILASFFVWLLLAGFLVFPGTFTSLQERVDGADQDDWENNVATRVLKSAKNIPLLVIASVAVGIAAVGMITLTILHARNYVWLLNRLFLPGLANALAGLISTLISIYTQKGGDWNVTAKVTAIVEGAWFVVCASLFVVFERILLRGVKKRHAEQLEKEGLPRTRKGAKARKKTREHEEAALEPGSVV